jgi:hypothetical protein
MIDILNDDSQAVMMAATFPEATVDAVDVSEEALQVLLCFSSLKITSCLGCRNQCERLQFSRQDKFGEFESL